MIADSERAALIALVRDVAQAEILPRFRQLDAAQIRTKTSEHDLVTEADLQAEAVLTERIARIMPDARVVGEEAVSQDRSVLDRLSGPGRTVVIDPVDGTWNFARGLALFGVILAVVEDGRTIWGVLYDPVLDDWITASEGQGAWYASPDGPARRLSVASPTTAAEATGFVPLFLFHGAHRDRVAQSMLRVGRANSLRCSCHEYRLIAQGHVDFILSGVLNPWDHAAGVLITQEAGGTAQRLDGRPYRPILEPGGLMVASDPSLCTKLVQDFS